jgi:hypothetical protein
MWKFDELLPGQPERDPHEAEFFNVGRLNYASALVRESGQNTLDARDNGPVTLRFTLSNQNNWINSIFYEGLIEHSKMANTYPNELKDLKSMPILLIEDFGTTGLDGPFNKPGNFFNFWWREGISGKTGKSRGRWGLGKTIFYVASDLRCYFGLSIRKGDDKEILLGKTVLKVHEYKNKKYHDYGYFDAIGYEPSQDLKEIQSFRKEFDLQRKKEHGLTIVIPAPREGVNFNSLVSSCIIHYFYPIMKERLIVEIKSDIKTEVLNRQTLCDVAQNLDWEGSEWENRAKNIGALITFIEEVSTSPDTAVFELTHPIKGLKISEDMFGETLDTIREKFSNNEFLWMRVPVTIKSTSKSEKKSYFDIYLQKDNSLEESDEFYIREGITISDIQNLRGRRVRGLLSVDDEAVSEFLGDCETPAHINWNEKTEEFQKKYLQPRDTLRFIKQSMREIVNILDQQQIEKDPNLLKDIFSIPIIKPGPNKDSPTPPKPPELPHPDMKFLISKVEGGLTVTLADKNKVPEVLNLRFAYDVRTGNPFKHYSRWDFDLANENIIKIVDSGHILRADANAITVSVDGSNFKLAITGFDNRRDLRVYANEVDNK